MTLDDLRNLDHTNLGSWPAPVKAVALILLIGLIVGAGYWFLWRDRFERLEEVKAKEEELREEFEEKQQRAANLEKYKRQLEEMRSLFGDMLDQLPSAERVPDLLTDISNEVLASGLRQELFQPQDSEQKDFYAEKPVQIRVAGKYDELGRFVSGVANMPRIVTLDGVKISRDSEGDPDGEATADLTMDITAKTYWYLQQGGNQ
jgi:type IV pilus assembly protein PilO